MDKNSFSGLRSVKTNAAQWAILVEFLIAHPEMVTHSFQGISGRETYRRLWDEISTQLNSMGYGCKSTDKWIDAFTKWKSKVKGKAQNIVLGMKKTGGGGPLPPLTPVEKKLMGIIGWTVVKGDDTSELGLNISPDDNQPYTNTSNTPYETFHKENHVALEIPSFSSETKTTVQNQLTLKVPPLVPLTITQQSNDCANSVLDCEEQILTGRTLGTKRKIEAKQTQALKFKKYIPSQRRRKGDEMTLLRMHQETLSVLKDINSNVSRLADTNEGILKKMTCSSIPNFHDYC